MFSFFKKEQSNEKNHKGEAFELELTAAVLAYEIARIDGIVSDEELDVLIEEIKKICEQAINNLKASSLKDMGKVMGALKPKIVGNAAPGFASSIVKKLLS